MTKAGLVRALHRDASLTRSEAGRVVDQILEIMKSTLATGERCLITNFGCFESVARKARRGRNPATGEIIRIHPRKTVVFRPAQKLEDRLT